MHRIPLPWPPAALHPNGRVHWAVRAKAAKKARSDARYAAQAAGARVLGWDGALVSVTFHPPTMHRRDVDGMLAACKSAFDGIADATGIDDSRWTFGPITVGQPRTGGEVVVELQQIRECEG